MKKVNFIEAVNSGKRFRFIDRPDWHKRCDYSDYEAVDDWLCHLVDCHFVDHCGSAVLEIINGEFELEEKEITITESYFYKALENVNCRNSHKSITCDISDLKKELGF